MLAGAREILVIVNPRDLDSFMNLLGDGSQFGIKIDYAVQASPRGLAEAFLIGESFLGQESCLLILGDNIFHGVGLGNQLRASIPDVGGHIFTYEVADPTRYGVANFDFAGGIKSVEEKPKIPKSNHAITGLYFFDNSVIAKAKLVRPSARGELEIISIIDAYLQEKSLSFTHLPRGTAWLDTGTFGDLHDAASFVKVLEERSSLKIGCLEEVAFKKGWLNATQIQKLIASIPNSDYRQYLLNLVERNIEK
jgi:glucose-1-phosphate thymidylyltransferase